LVTTFRYNTSAAASSDQLGVFFRGVLREKGVDIDAIGAIAMCSVVPHLDYTVQSACQKYMGLKPFVIKPGVKTGLKIEYLNPLEVGADRIANAMGAVAQFPERALLLVDLGTATTFCAVSKDRRYLGGVIQVGMRLAMDALQNNTAKLSGVAIAKPDQVVGRSTKASLQAGVYYGQLAMIQAMVRQISDETFGGEKPCVIGTGGFARGFAEEGVFDVVLPDLVLHGLRVAYGMNHEEVLV
jgi:type III pantothenate kinase